MRMWPVLLLLPLAGCLDSPEPIPFESDYFAALARGDPSPVPHDNCADLLDDLNTRALREAAVSLQQSLEGGYGGRVMFFDDVAMDMAESSDGATATMSSAPAAPSARDADVTGTNNQELGVDEADILKTDGEWTYVLRGNLLTILHSSTVGNLTKVSTIELDGYGSQLLLADRGNDDPTDDRLLVITNEWREPEKEPADRDERIGFAPDYYGHSYTKVTVFALLDRISPIIIEEQWIEGSLSGARLVDGVAYTVVHQWADGLGLRTWAHPDDADLKKRGMSWEQYAQSSEDRQRAIRSSIADDAMAANERMMANATLADHLPDRILDSGQHATTSGAACDRVLVTPSGTGRGVSTILSIDLNVGSTPHRITQIIGSHPLIYGAQDALVLAAASQDTWWFWAQPALTEATDLHWFDLDGIDVTHRASGRVDGIVQDQFGIDVHDGQLRVATTTGSWGRWWWDESEREPMMNHVAVFQEVAGALVETGKVGGIAPDERLWAARFTDDRAYLITFEQIDPLWIIDLSDPTDPTILGELEIPGVSTYIHPLSDDHLLTIGIGPREGGELQITCEDGPDGEDCVVEEQPQGLDWNRIQVSLFDISDPTAPFRADVYDVSLPTGSGYSWGFSGAVHEHKAFNYWDRLGMLAIPVTWNHHERTCEQNGNTRTCTEINEFHTGLDLITVDEAAGTLSRYGGVDQDTLLTDEGSERGYYWGAEVERSYFLGFPDQFPDQPVSVYSLSRIGMTAHDLATLQLQDAVRLDAETYYDYPVAFAEPVEG